MAFGQEKELQAAYKSGLKKKDPVMRAWVSVFLRWKWLIGHEELVLSCIREGLNWNLERIYSQRALT